MRLNNTTKIECMSLANVLSVRISFNNLKLQLYPLLISRYRNDKFIIFRISMQSQQKQLQINNLQTTNHKSVKKQASIFENAIDQELKQKTRQLYISKNSSLQHKINKVIKVNKFHWTLQENILYKRFLEQNINLVQSDFHHRRVSKINVLMSQCIKTKNFKQCRSHHQTMLVNHKSVARIIKFIENLQNEHFPLQIKSKSQEEAPQNFIQNDSAQQMDEKMMEDEENIEIVTSHPKIRQFQQIAILTQSEISQIVIEVNLLNRDPYNIQDYFQPNVWWDGSEI